VLSTNYSQAEMTRLINLGISKSSKLGLGKNISEATIS